MLRLHQVEVPGLGEQVREGSQTRSCRSTGVCILDRVLDLFENALFLVLLELF